jgi:uncharacterized protein YhdP
MAAEATTISATKLGRNQKRQFQDIFGSVIPFSFVATEASIASGAVSAGDVTVTGAALGDFVLVASKSDIADLVITGAVTAANTVTVTLANNTGGAVTALSGGFTINGVVLAAGPIFADPSAG